MLPDKNKVHMDIDLLIMLLIPSLNTSVTSASNKLDNRDRPAHNSLGSNDGSLLLRKAVVCSEIICADQDNYCLWVMPGRHFPILHPPPQMAHLVTCME